MAYITLDEYEALYGPFPLGADAFPAYAQQASDLLDSVTRYAIMREGFTSLPLFVQELVQKAAAAQVLYFTQNGGIEAVMSGQAGRGFSVGKVRLDGASSGGSGAGVAASLVSPAVRALLEQTGLMERSVQCLDQFPLCF